MKRMAFIATLFIFFQFLLPAQEGENAHFGYIRSLSGSRSEIQGLDEASPQEVTLNTPLYEGDRVKVNQSSRMVLRLAEGSEIFLDRNTTIDLISLPLSTTDQSDGVLHIWSGSAYIHLSNNLPIGQWRIDTPSGKAYLKDSGIYRVDIETNDRTRLSVIEGGARIAGFGSSVSLGNGEAVVIEYGYPPSHAAGISSFNDSFESYFMSERPKPRNRGYARKYIPSDLYVYSDDLDEYGEWINVPNYGYSWRPYGCGPEWRPYCNGRWNDYPWGVTWVPYEPWGWVAYHYGRWSFASGIGWFWIPGSVWGPAWVAWSFGPLFISWCPLGYYGDPLWNYYGWNTVNITNIYTYNVTKIIQITPPRNRWPRTGNTPGVIHESTMKPIHLPRSRIDDYKSGRISPQVLAKEAMLERPVVRRGGPVVPQGPTGIRSIPSQTIHRGDATKGSRPILKTEEGSNKVIHNPRSRDTLPVSTRSDSTPNQKRRAVNETGGSRSRESNLPNDLFIDNPPSRRDDEEGVTPKRWGNDTSENNNEPNKPRIYPRKPVDTGSEVQENPTRREPVGRSGNELFNEEESAPRERYQPPTRREDVRPTPEYSHPTEHRPQVNTNQREEPGRTQASPPSHTAPKDVPSRPPAPKPEKKKD